MKVDAVITYVDSSDKNWIATYKKYYGDAISSDRYGDYGVLTEQIRCIRRYMSFVRNIYVVVSSESQLKRKNILDAKVITHSQIIPLKYLPTFNSTTIEMFLYKIPGLSEQFIYFNDDIFPTSDCSVDDFFTEDGRPRIGFKSVKFLDDTNTFRVQCKNSFDAACRLNSVPQREGFIKPYHICLPHTKSSFIEVWSKMRREIEESITRKRDPKNFNQYLFILYNYFGKNIDNYSIDYYYSDIKNRPFKDIIDAISEQKYKIVCINQIGVHDVLNRRILLKDALYNILKKGEHITIRDIVENRIDFIFPYVDADDPKWIEIYNRYAPKKKETVWDNWSTGMERFRANDLLKYVFRGIEQNLPWIGHVHLIVMQDSQVPAWIDRKRVHIVHHEDFIPKQFLPTFNSSTIEMFIHRIPGLSEKFIYSNDDVFITSHLNPHDFFVSDSPVFGLVKSKYNPNWIGDILRRQDHILISGKDDGIVYRTQHTLTPYLKSTMYTVYDKYKKEILNSCTRFREVHNYNQWIFSEYQMMNLEYINNPIKSFHTEIKSNNPKILYDYSDYQTVCLNDSKLTTEEDLKLVQSKLNTLFPNKSKYEL